MKQKYSASIFIVMLILAGAIMYSQTTTEKNMTVTELKEQIGKNKNLVILDVRTPAELEGELGQISDAINIPVQELGGRIKELEKYKDKEIAVICRSGNRSRHATKLLNENGFNARNVTGGMIDWRKNGF